MELGCGNGILWKSNFNELSSSIKITLSDNSKGMLKTAKKSLKVLDFQFNYKLINVNSIPYQEGQFDVIIANHMLYYVSDIGPALNEIKRVMKPDGLFYASTISFEHQKEMKELLINFDDKLETFVNLENNFRLENGKDLLKDYFDTVTVYEYQNDLRIPVPEPIFKYALSCFNGTKWKFLKQKEPIFLSYCNELISQKGYIKITNKSGILECHNS